jgi:hypothetical protein
MKYKNALITVAIIVGLILMIRVSVVFDTDIFLWPLLVIAGVGAAIMMVVFVVANVVAILLLVRNVLTWIFKKIGLD